MGGAGRRRARAKPATEEDWSTEYLDAILAAKVVDGVDAAIAHIERYGSHHTDAIITEDKAAAEKFLREVDSAIVLHNASTQFADGGEFGFGAEIGIATGKLHARGPVGVEQLTTFKYRVRGTGAVIRAFFLPPSLWARGRDKRSEVPSQGAIKQRPDPTRLAHASPLGTPGRREGNLRPARAEVPPRAPASHRPACGSVVRRLVQSAACRASRHQPVRDQAAAARPRLVAGDAGQSAEGHQRAWRRSPTGSRRPKRSPSPPHRGERTRGRHRHAI